VDKSEDRPVKRRVIVIGGGVTGLAAAHFLSLDPSRPRLRLLEETSEPGGKLRASELAGHEVEMGPDGFATTPSDALDLCSALGLHDELVSARASSFSLWTRRGVRSLAPGSLVGIPVGLASVLRSRHLSVRGMARAGMDLVLPRTIIEGDVSVGALISARFGRELEEQVVAPLIGGVYASAVGDLSAQATMPMVFEAARAHRSLLLALRKFSGRSSMTRPRALMTLRGGLHQLVPALVASVGKDCDICCRVRVENIRRDGSEWVVGTDASEERADALVLAVPAGAAAHLVKGVAPVMSTELEKISYVSVAIATFVFPRDAFGAPPQGSGVLISPALGRLMTACTWLSNKWLEVQDDDHFFVRCSAGQSNDQRIEKMDDAEIVAQLLQELSILLARSLPQPEVRLTRWHEALPQYRVGHRSLVEGIDAKLPPGMFLAGAAYRGLGIPSCIADARRAANGVLAHLGGEHSSAHARPVETP
jgi:oxygen-dependent protoporphyrinogen oxidase